MPKFVKVAKISEIPNQSAKWVEVEDERVALFNLEGEFYAIDDACSHEDGPLCEGIIEGEEVECPWHSARFNIKTGEATCLPAPCGVTKYNVRIVGDDIEIEV